MNALPKAPHFAGKKLMPFSDGAIDGLFFSGAGRQASLDEVHHMLRYGPSLLVLHGDQGVGKHFMVDHLIGQIDPDLYDVALLQADVMFTVDAFLASLGPPWHSRQAFHRSNYLNMMAAVAQSADDESKILLCVIREAQFLDDETCDLIARLLAGCVGLPVKFLMVVDAPDLGSYSHIVSLVQHIPDHYVRQLRAFNQSETKEYIEYRMSACGVDQIRFSDAQIESLFERSQGNVRQLNRLANQLLAELLSASSPKAKKKMSLPYLHLAALIVLVVALLVLFFSQQPFEPDVVESENDASLVEIDKPVVTSEKTTLQDPVVDVPETPAALVESPPPVDVKPARADVDSPLAPKAPDLKAEETKAITVSTEPVLKPTAEVKKTVEQPNPREAWVLAQPADYYGLQLIGAKEMATINKFLARYPSLQNLVHYQTIRNGAPWFVVVQGSYPDYGKAKAAVSELPQTLQKQGPWVRKYQAIQKDLKK